MPKIVIVLSSVYPSPGSFMLIVYPPNTQLTSNSGTAVGACVITTVVVASVNANTPPPLVADTLIYG